MSDPPDRRKPSLSASRIATSDTSGRSSPSRSRLMPTSTSKTPAAQVAQNLDALEGVDVRVEVADLDAELLIVLRQVFGHPLGERRHQHAFATCRRDRGSRRAGRRPGPSPAAPRSADPSVRSDGSPARPPRRRPSAARTGRAWRTRKSPGATRCSHSSKLRGRLSSAEGRRKPYSTSTSLRERSPWYMPRTCGIVWWLSSTMSRHRPAGSRAASAAAAPAARPVRWRE